MVSIDYEKMDFEKILLDELDVMTKKQADRLPFGVVGMSRDGLIELYNQTESNLAGLPAASVMGEPFFSNVGQCMNNWMVAQRFEDEVRIDAVIDYVLTLRMRPTPVRLRLLKAPAISRRYILIKR